MNLTLAAKRIRRSLRDCRPRLSLGLDLFEEGFCLDFFGFLIALPFLDRWAYEPHEIMESWGVKYFERSIHADWGRNCKVIRLPWDYDHIKHEVRRPNGTWVPYVGSWEVSEHFGGKQPDGRWEASYPYRYVLKSGEVQERTATVYVERREWRQKWLGERTGSWKGGTIGCGWDLRDGETPEQALRRMELERRFN